MANELTTLESALVLDGNGVQLTSAFFLTSSDTAVATTAFGFGGQSLIVNGVGEGTATITATRVADGATATLEVTVTESEGFTIQLGTPYPR